MRRIIIPAQSGAIERGGMVGTVINIIAVVVGGALGTLFGARLPERLRESVLWALGLFTIALGVSLTLDSQNALIPLGSLLAGGLLGEWWRIDDRLKRLGAWLEARFAGSADADAPARFIKGFVGASLIFNVGAQGH